MINALPPIQSGLSVSYSESGHPVKDEHSRQNSHSLQGVNHHSQSNSEASYLPPPLSASYSNPEQTLTPPNETRDYLNSPEEVLFMQGNIGSFTHFSLNFLAIQSCTNSLIFNCLRMDFGYELNLAHLLTSSNPKNCLY